MHNSKYGTIAHSIISASAGLFGLSADVNGVIDRCIPPLGNEEYINFNRLIRLECDVGVVFLWSRSVGIHKDVVDQDLP